MESRQFDKVKVEKKIKQHKMSNRSNIIVTTMPILWLITCTKTMPHIQKDMCRLWKNQSF